MEAIQRYLNSILSRRSVQALCVWGDPGIGKTYTIRTILDQTPCRSFSLSANDPDSALTRALPFCENLEPEAQKVWASLQESALVHPSQIAKALAAGLTDLAPVVLHLEDLHLASVHTWQWMKGLADCLPRIRGVGLLVTARVAQPEPFHNHLLRPLSREASDALLQTGHSSLSPEGLEWIYRRALGNPGFGLEFLKHLYRQGYFWFDGDRWHWRIPPKDLLPPTLEALMYEWMAPLEHRARRLLESRALLPDAIEDSVWAEVVALPSEAFLASKNSLQRSGLVREGRLFHPLLAEVLNRDLDGARRKTYATRALAALEAAGLEPSAEIVKNAALDQAQATQIYLRLAGTAKAKEDLPRAGHWLALASENSQAPDQVRLALEAAQLLRHTDLTRALQLAQSAAMVPPHDLEAVYLSAELCVIHGDVGQAETLLGLLPSTQLSTLRWWETLIRLNYTKHANYDEVLRLWQLHPDFHRLAQPETVLYICAVLGQKGQFEAAFTLTAEILDNPQLEPFLHCRTLEMRSNFHYLLGKSEEAVAYSRRSIVIARTLGRPVYLGQLLRKEGVYVENLNRFDQAVACYKEAIALFLEHGSPLDQANAEVSLASVLVELGEFEEAEALFVQGLAFINQSENRLLQCNTRNLFALLYLDWKPTYGGSLALKHARVAVELANGLGNQQMLHATLTTLAQAEAYFGNPERALQLARESLEERYVGASAGRKASSQYAVARALEANGQIAEAITALEEAIRAYEILGFESTAHRWGLELDRLTGDLPRAKARLEWFQSNKLFGWVKIALRYFPQLQPSHALAQVTQALPCLCLLGPAMLTMDGQTAPYRGRKRIELLAYLAETRIVGKTEASVLELMDSLYPDIDEAAAKAVVRQLVYLLRNQLGSKAIISTASGYALGALDTDVEQFLKNSEPQLWRGVYLDGLAEGWYPEVREALLEKLQLCSSEMLLLNPAEALRLGEIWQDLEPFEHRALRLSLQAVQACGDKRKLERLYKRGSARFKEVGETLPPTPQEFLLAKTT